jgi:hypothetical protein
MAVELNPKKLPNLKNLKNREALSELFCGGLKESAMFRGVEPSRSFKISSLN